METKKCPVCGEDIPVGTQFCPMCGERLTDNGLAEPTARSTAERRATASARKRPEGRHGRKFRLSPLAIMATAIVILAVAGYFIFCRDRQATDWHALAVNYLAANSIDEDSAYICADDERHCVYYLEGDNDTCEILFLSLIKYDLKTGLKQDLSACKDTPILGSITEWGVLDDDRRIWILSFNGVRTDGLCTYDTISDTWTNICATSLNIELCGSEIIKCSRHGMICSYGDTLVDADYAFMVTYYDWDGNEVEPYRYVGTIGPYRVVVELVFGDGKVCGSYYYLHYGKESRMELDGSITMDNRVSFRGYAYDSCYLGDSHLVETIYGHVGGDYIKGIWTNISTGNTLSVNLTLQ